MIKNLRLLFVFATVIGAYAVHAQICGLPKAKPESVGFSTERLNRLDRMFQMMTDNKALAGAVTALARHGELIECRTYGYQDLNSDTPMRVNSIFRIASMTKPITGAAMMILYEEGKWKPSDPIVKYIPEFSDLKVFAGTDSKGQMILESPKHPPTIGELLTHTAGFTYGFFGHEPVEELYRQVSPLSASSQADFVKRLGKLPLLYQPGERWVYSLSVDIQGVLIERMSGMPLQEFLRKRIFDPLGMKDTDFFVPMEKLSRLATVYTISTDGPSSLKPVPREAGVSKEPGFPSGGGGLYSTAGDYLRFAQMLLNAGEVDGVRILAPSSVELMRTNHLSDDLLTKQFGIANYHVQPGLGFGYDMAVFDNPLKLGDPVGRGTFSWDGATGVWFWIDPTNEVVFIGMIQRGLALPPESTQEDLSRALIHQPDFEALSRALVYQALIRPNE